MVDYNYEEFVGQIYSQVVDHINTKCALDGYDMHVVFDASEEADDDEKIHVFVDPVTDRIYKIRVKE